MFPIRKARALFVVVALVVAWVASLVGTSSSLWAQEQGDPLRVHQWPLDVIGADVAWGHGTGKGITVAVIDTGVDLAHEDLEARLVPGNDFVDGDRVPQDVNGHGTHVAGVIAATKGNAVGLIGVAPEASIMPIRALDADGVGTPLAVIEAVKWAVDNGAAVINLSVTEVGSQSGTFTSSLASAIERAWEKGVIVVLASGNDGSDSTSGPSYQNVPAIVVSATDRNDQISGYSKPVGNARWALAAPGGAGKGNSDDDVASTYWMSGQRNLYATMAGTSMAVPHVAGAAALMRSMGLSPTETVDRLLGSARDLGAPGRDAVFGAGRLDLTAAVQGTAQSVPQTVVTEPPVSSAAVVPELIPVTTLLNPVIDETPPTPAPEVKTPRTMAPVPEMTLNSTTSIPVTTSPQTLPEQRAVSDSQALAQLPEPAGSYPLRKPLIAIAALCALAAGSRCWRTRARPGWRPGDSP